MNKSRVLWIILDLIFLVVFNAVFFIIGGAEHPLPVWISYGFIHFAYGMLIFANHLVSRGKSRAVFGFSLYSLTILYFFIELIVGIAFIFALPDNIKVTVVVQVILAGIILIVLIANMLANESTANAEEKRQLQINYIKVASDELLAVLGLIGVGNFSQETKKTIEKAFDILRTSPVKAHPSVAQLETHILIVINDLKSAVNAGNDTEALEKGKALSIMITERNRQLKIVN